MLHLQNYESKLLITVEVKQLILGRVNLNVFIDVMEEKDELVMQVMPLILKDIELPIVLIFVLSVVFIVLVHVGVDIVDFIDKLARI